MKKYSLKYHLLNEVKEKKNIVLNESTIIDLRCQVNQILINENYIGSIDDTINLSDLPDRAIYKINNLGIDDSLFSKLKYSGYPEFEEVEKTVNSEKLDSEKLDAADDMAVDTDAVDTDLQSILDELNSEEYEFDIQIPGIVNRKISLDFASAVALLFVYKSHNPQTLVLEVKSPGIMSAVYDSSNMQEFTTNLLEWLRDKSSKLSAIEIDSIGKKEVPRLFQDIVKKANDKAATTFYTGMATKMGYLLEDVMQEVFYKSKYKAENGDDTSYTEPTITEPANSQAKMALLILLLLKSSKNGGIKMSNDIITISSTVGPQRFNFFNSKSFNDISGGSSINNTSYTNDVLQIAKNSDCTKLEKGIENAIEEAKVLLQSQRGIVELKDIQTRTGTSEQEEVKGNPAFDFAIQDTGSGEYCFIDLKSANNKSQSRDDIGVSGANKNNSAIKALRNLAVDNGLVESKEDDPGPRYLGILKAIYTLYLQEGSSSENFINIVECKTLYGTVSESCSKSVLEKENKENKKDSKGNKRKTFFHIDCSISHIDNLKGNTEKSESVLDKITANKKVNEEIIEYIKLNRGIVDKVLPTYSDFNDKINKAKDIFEIEEENGKLIINGFNPQYSDYINFDSIPKFKSKEEKKDMLDYSDCAQREHEQTKKQQASRENNKYLRYYARDYSTPANNLFIYSRSPSPAAALIRNSVDFLFKTKIEEYTADTNAEGFNPDLFNLNKTFFSNSNKITILIKILKGIDNLRSKNGNWISSKYGSTLSRGIYETFKLNKTEAGDLQNKLEFRQRRIESYAKIKVRTAKVKENAKALNKPAVTNSIPANEYRNEYSGSNTITKYIEQLNNFLSNPDIDVEKIDDDDLEDADTPKDTAIPIQSTDSIILNPSQKVDSYNRKGKVLREVYSYLFRK